MRTELQDFIGQIKITPEIHDRLKAEIVEEIAKFLTTHPKYTIDHSRDPPWDYSGELHKVAGHFLPNLYATVGDFIKEYSGETTASFSSGCGWFYPSIEDELCNGEFTLGNVYADYFVDVLKQQHDLEDDDVDDAFSEILDNLDDRNFELNEEIKRMPMIELHREPLKNDCSYLFDIDILQDDILELIHGCDDTSEVMLFCSEDAGGIMLERIYTFDACHLRRDTDDEFNPDSPYLIWQYLMTSALNNRFLPACITVKTLLSNGNTEIRSIRIMDGIVEPLSADEVEQCYSTCSDCGAYQEPPDDYVFCEFNEFKS